MFALQRDLNERQLEAATFGDAPLRVIAGPGTGKTTTLTARVEVLLERGVTPERILLLTFTRRSAREIVSRVRACAVPTALEGSSGGTFHSVAHHALRRHHAAAGPARGFRRARQRRRRGPAGPGARGDGIVSRERRLPKKWNPGALYSRTVNTGRHSPRSCTKSPRGASRASRKSDRSSAPSWLESRRWACWTSTICSCTGEWRYKTKPWVRARRAYDHILVDEFQDVNICSWTCSSDCDV